MKTNFTLARKALVFLMAATFTFGLANCNSGSKQDKGKEGGKKGGMEQEEKMKKQGGDTANME